MAALIKFAELDGGNAAVRRVTFPHAARPFPRARIRLYHVKLQLEARGVRKKVFVVLIADTSAGSGLNLPFGNVFWNCHGAFPDRNRIDIPR